MHKCTFLDLLSGIILCIFVEIHNFMLENVNNARNELCWHGNIMLTFYGNKLCWYYMVTLCWHSMVTLCWHLWKHNNFADRWFRRQTRLLSQVNIHALIHAERLGFRSLAAGQNNSPMKRSS